MSTMDVKRRFFTQSDRVKGVDLHPSEPWMLTALHTGKVHIWNYETQVSSRPVRCAKFVARKNWLIMGSDDMYCRVFNYNTLEKVHEFMAHTDFMRSLAVHPQQSLLFTSGDDKLIKVWDWDNEGALKKTFDGHTHYVMAVVVNTKDTDSFASASLDKTIKVWHFNNTHPIMTLEGHESGVNCLDYHSSQSYLISGSDDRTVKIWDYLTKTCVVTLHGHTHNISAVCFHPELPLILAASEDSTVRVWIYDEDSAKCRLETTLNYELERCWAIGAVKGSKTVAIGYDKGAVVVQM